MVSITTISSSTRSLMKGILAGNRTSLSRGITLIESTAERHKVQAELLLDSVLASSHKTSSSFRLGIAGPPGAGKSTFIESLGLHLVQSHNQSVAVLAVDPSSNRSRGSILGDKTRMAGLSANKRAYVRPSPSRGTLGGVTQHTNDTITLCEAAGFDTVIVESVGLGQSETTIDDAVDMLLLLVPPASGDELQGSKKGIVEVADVVVVNKADGALKASATHAAADYKRALQLVRRKDPEWSPAVVLVSSIENTGIDSVWNVIQDYKKSVDIGRKRDVQGAKWMMSDFIAELVSVASTSVEQRANELSAEISKQKICPRSAARKLLDSFLKTT